ncbi:hypothetical protein VTJ49DRAFT_6226 [Mycothermus thermophilus]|uniref:Thioredoxin domain-containing protein n=1 Tax=Humicola insolens TaxID=85995 RepID=A0ABR3VKU4_HUMIN
MRWFSLSLLLGSAAWAVAESDDETREATFFNGIKVPPMLELTPDNWDKEIKASKYMIVKHYSPYCPHCVDFAPTFQTLYEFYYTSSPGGSPPKDADFTTFYDFRFGDVNCVAYNDLCARNKVQSYPTTIIYEDGEPVVTFRGTKNIGVLSDAIEDILKKAKPGTRPAKVNLPKPGDKSAPEPEAKEAADVKTPEPGSNSPSKNEVPPAPKGPPKKEAAADSKTPALATMATPSKETGSPKYVAYGFTPPVAPQKQLAPKTSPNPTGQSVPLTAEMFNARVAKTRESWFIKFYAPWCHHCKKLAPNWEQLGKETKGRLNIGEVNCDAEKKLCKDLEIKGYPTMLFFRGTDRAEYQGLRGLGDLKRYADHAAEIAQGVQDVDADEFKALEEKEDVIFLYLYDHGATTEDFNALERLPVELIGRARLVKSRDVRLYERFKIWTWPRLLVSREGRPTYYTPSTPREMRDINMLRNWMRRVWLPLVPELTAANAREIMDGRTVVLGVLNRADEDSFNTAIREMKSATNEWMDKQIQLFQLERQELRDAKQLRIEEARDRGDERAEKNAKNIRINLNLSDRKEVIFAWVDGAFWQRWLRTTYGVDIKDGERVIINDEDNRRYWDQTSTGNPIVPSRTSILETLTKVTANPPKLKPKLTIGFFSKIIFDIRTTFRDHPYLSSGCVLGVAFGCLSLLRGRLRRPRGVFRLGEAAAAMREAKAPILGVGSMSKAD